MFVNAERKVQATQMKNKRFFLSRKLKERKVLKSNTDERIKMQISPRQLYIALKYYIILKTFSIGKTIGGNMFRKMRREKQQLAREETLEILKNGKTAILALSGDDGYPYAVPVNYVFCEADEAQKISGGESSLGKILFHGAKIGHKIDALKRCQKVSLCVIQKDDVIKEKLTTAYKSVIVFGTARILRDEEEIFRAAEILGLRYNEDAQFVRDEIHRMFDALSCVEIQIEHATGKQGSIFLKKD